MPRTFHGASLCSTSLVKVTLAVLPGTDIIDACKEAHALAYLLSCDVQFKFNKDVINMTAASDPQSIATAYIVTREKVCIEKNDVRGVNLKDARWDDCTQWPEGIGPLPTEES